MIYAVRKFIIPKSDPKIKIARNFKNFNVNDFLRDLSQIPWETTVIPDNPNTCWKIWKSFYLGVLDRHAPFRHVRIRGNSMPWVNSDIKNLMRLRDYHKKQAVKFNSQFHWDKFRETRNELNSSLHIVKKLLLQSRWSVAMHFSLTGYFGHVVSARLFLWSAMRSI